MRVSGARGPPLHGLTVSALMATNKSVRGDWQRGPAADLPLFLALIFCGLWLLPGRSLFDSSLSKRASLHKSRGIKETQLWVDSKLNQDRNHLIIQTERQKTEE